MNFFYNILLIAIYASVVGSAFCMKSMGCGLSRSEYVALGGLFSCYLLDTLICFMTEYLPAFAGWYNRLFLSTPSIKTALYLGIGFFTLYFWNGMNRSKFQPIQVIILLCFGLYLLGVPMLQRGRLQAWLYYLPYQILSILLASYALRTTGGRGQGEEPETAPEEPRFISPAARRFLLLTTLVLSGCILIEDTIVISLRDRYADGLVSIYNRNVCEDILRLVYSVLYFVGVNRWATCFRMAGASEAPVPEETGEAAPTVEEPAADPADEPLDKSEEYKILIFGRSLQLTEREMDVFTHLLAGENNQQISNALHISQGTVKAHIHNIFQKANISHRYELLRQFDAFSVHTPED